MNTPKTVVIADDHDLYRRGLRELLTPDFEVVGEAREGGQAVDLVLEHRPDVVLLDVMMPGMDGIEAARQIRDKAPATGVVIVSAADDDVRVFDAIQAGVCGYVVKDDSAEAVVQAVSNAAEGKAYLPPLIAKRVLEGISSGGGRREVPARGATPLTNRELMVLRLLAEGRRNREIAAELCISERTVGNHIAAIYDKLCIYDRSQAIVYAIKKGVIRI